jgi:hypothetical protein
MARIAREACVSSREVSIAVTVGPYTSVCLDLGVDPTRGQRRSYPES